MAHKLTEEEEIHSLFQEHLSYQPMPPALAARLQAIVLAEMTKMLQAVQATLIATEPVDSLTTTPDVLVGQ
jgi:hypothetical protein